MFYSIWNDVKKVCLINSMYNVSMKVWNTYYLTNIEMFTFVEICTFDLLENLSLKKLI
jgi:hypothetical protein